MESSDNKAIIFSDGSSRGNPGPGGWAAIVSRGGEVEEMGGYSAQTTNNRMELQAACEGLSRVQGHVREVVLYTDSSYLIKGMTEWMTGWIRNNWKTQTKQDVSNRDLWEKLAELTASISVSWNYVGGHAGVPGNERCDQIATSFADQKPDTLFRGSSKDYSIDLTNISFSPSEKKKSRSGEKPLAYASFVDGVFKLHDSWAACEKEVKGKRGARFKKVFSEQEIENLRNEWRA